ncbi:MAG: hypothetical protein COV34_01370 [Candidatus Zambryskibacteria bacterium CG10_big_fil_rev_8_21_14_0_10_42_12]|uniref:Uncharacterized protein n=1 Tax=Candidatus Zambryskibacteria bacterium CG10_big_fil_rev_8_21_14_0_10_42_12 TaxID=1975115 RepID=A0A2H0QVH9_9BACT|nr:MAG: hypothetical protein COV34_01370 [Candidatus Zambryskibacteria bacterium CG10_big_fil_rev_8_21_14_0_10_42_12]
MRKGVVLVILLSLVATIVFGWLWWKTTKVTQEVDREIRRLREDIQQSEQESRIEAFVSSQTQALTEAHTTDMRGLRQELAQNRQELERIVKEVETQKALIAERTTRQEVQKEIDARASILADRLKQLAIRVLDLSRRVQENLQLALEAKGALAELQDHVRRIKQVTDDNTHEIQELNQMHTYRIRTACVLGYSNDPDLVLRAERVRLSPAEFCEQFLSQ